MLKILEAITPSRIGGAEVCVVNTCKEFAGRGVQTGLFCPSERPFVHYSRSLGLNPTTWQTCGKFDPLTVIRLAWLIRQGGYGLIHTHLSTASLLGACAARLAGVPSVAHVHGLNSATCFRLSKLVIAVSEAVRQHLCKQGLNPAKVQVVHNGIDLTRFFPRPLEEAKRLLGYGTKQTLVGLFGRLSPEKGQQAALIAMAQLLRSSPGTRLLLVGEGPSRNALVQLAADLGITDRVDLFGFQQDVRHIMAACDLVLVPSRKEGFGLAAVEAMAMARPVIATRVGGLPEVVSEGETGLLVPAEEPLALAAAIELALQQRDRAATMGLNGRRRAENFFSLPIQSGKLLAALQATTMHATLQPPLIQHCTDEP